MSGVIINGQQWEHCGCCGKYIRFPQSLGYIVERKTKRPIMDICAPCVDIKLKTREIRFSQVVPAPEWKQVVVEFPTPATLLSV